MLKAHHRILHLEDNAFDAELIRERIIAGDDATWEFLHVDSREPFEAALAAGKFDLVLTDYNLPGYDGLSALRFARSTYPEVPIIVISGTLSEDDAVEALKAGATDYVFKQRLQRLPAAARRALGEAEEHRRRLAVEAKIADVSARLNVLARSSRDVVWMNSIDASRTLTYVSPSIEDTWGVPASVFYDDPQAWRRSIHPEDVERVLDAIEAWISGRADRYDEEYRVVRPDATVRWVHDQGTKLVDPSSRLAHVGGVARDITERKEMARIILEKEKFFRATFEQAAVGIVFVDLGGGRMQFNRRYAEILGYSPEELTDDIEVTHPEDIAGMKERTRKLLDGESPVTQGTKRYLRKDGRVIWCDVSNSLVYGAEGRPTHILAVIQEVTERILAEQRLKESEALFRSTVNAMVEGVTVQDSSNRIVAVNRSAEQVSGIAAEHLVGRTLDDAQWQAFAEDGSEMPAHALPSAIALRTGELQRNVVVGLRFANGRQVWVEVNAQPIQAPGASSPQGVVTTYHDITESRQAAQALRESERRQRTLLANLQGMAYRSHNQAGSWMLEFVSEGCRGLLGIEPVALTSGRIRKNSLIHPDDRLRLRQALTGTQWHTGAYEYRVRHANGEWIWVLDKCSAILDPHGKAVAIEGFLSDISERKRAEEQLRALNAGLEARIAERTGQLQSANVFLDSIIENMPDMVFVKDAAELKYVRFNRAGEDLIGYTRGELIGKSDHDLFPKEEADVFAARDRQAIASGALLEIVEQPVRTRLRGTRYLHTKKIPILDEQGQPRYVLGISRDITERKEKDREIITLNEALGTRAAELEAANRELEAFSYSVSHDLRAPLHAVKGFADALAQSSSAKLDATDRHYLERIRSRAAFMDQLIEDMLGLARISRSDLVALDFDLSALAREILEEAHEREPARACEFTVQERMRAHADSRLLRIVLTNLVANAWKFSGGRDRTRIEIGQLPAQGLLKSFFVRDHGAGFDPAHSEKLFGTFQRLHSQSEFPGTGIGLATVRRVIERHGGHVWAEGEVNGGATFYFSLPSEAGFPRAR